MLAAIRLKKPTAVFTGRGLQNSCEDENIKVICPTCQTLFDAPMPDCIKWCSQRQLIGRRHAEQAIVVVIHPIEIESYVRLGERLKRRQPQELPAERLDADANETFQLLDH